ncbi:hypothetical protein M422DRAFT_271651 [Sphaerobolus stellatus SS14]|uniref:Uncharacterized protein n=1 Tax=Sphaerobolus stellatus (strain SS14) TaxID=990650 RepID=A0A0C9UPF0_SPHS4|nr:hypothetical protein M422DRAFT_271651 [Sphaerobolus stellatus SS14]
MDGRSKQSPGRSPTLLGASDNLCAAFGDSDTFLHAKSIVTAPVPTLIDHTLPGFSCTVLAIPESCQNKETSPRIEHSPVFYTQSIGSWALWDIPSNNVYFPAQMLEVYKSDYIVEIPGGLVLPDGQQKMQPEQHTLSWTQVCSIFEDPVESIPAKRLVRLLWPAINDYRKLRKICLMKWIALLKSNDHFSDICDEKRD